MKRTFINFIFAFVIFTFPLKTFAQYAYPPVISDTYGTGYVSGIDYWVNGDKSSGDIKVGEANLAVYDYLGWVMFDISYSTLGIPSNAEITYVRLSLQVNNNSSSDGFTLCINELNIDPRNETAQDIAENYSSTYTENFKCQVIGQSSDYVDINLTGTSGLSNLQNSISNGSEWWGIALYESGFDDKRVVFHGNDASASVMPELVIGYTIPVPCNSPTDLATTTNVNSALLNWGSVSGSEGYEIKYKPTTSSNWITQTTSAWFYSISDLPCETSYDWQIRTNCGDNNYSDWVVGSGFTTLQCNAILGVPNLISPDNNASLYCPITFQWEHADNAVESSLFTYVDGLYNYIEWNTNESFTWEETDLYDTSFQWGVASRNGEEIAHSEIRTLNLIQEPFHLDYAEELTNVENCRVGNTQNGNSLNDTYWCSNNIILSGNEMIYYFTPTLSGNAYVLLEYDEHSSLRLFCFSDTICFVNGLVGSYGASDSFEVVEGETYYVVIEECWEQQDLDFVLKVFYPRDFNVPQLLSPIDDTVFMVNQEIPDLVWAENLNAFQTRLIKKMTVLSSGEEFFDSTSFRLVSEYQYDYTPYICIVPMKYEWYIEQRTYGSDTIKQSESWVFWVLNSTSFLEDDKNNISLYPNPTDTKLILDGVGNCKIRIHNSLGQLIYSKTTKEKQKTIDVSQWESGIYYIEIRDETGQLFYSKKLIKN